MGTFGLEYGIGSCGFLIKCRSNRPIRMFKDSEIQKWNRLYIMMHSKFQIEMVDFHYAHEFQQFWFRTSPKHNYIIYVTIPNQNMWPESSKPPLGEDCTHIHLMPTSSSTWQSEELCPHFLLTI